MNVLRFVRWDVGTASGRTMFNIRLTRSRIVATAFLAVRRLSVEPLLPNTENSVVKSRSNMAGTTFSNARYSMSHAYSFVSQPTTRLRGRSALSILLMFVNALPLYVPLTAPSVSGSKPLRTPFVPVPK